MIAKQYSFTLPADYDMNIIDQRIREKGHMIDGFPGLLFKAYLWTCSNASNGRPENLYAPFYVWKDSAAMSDFISGPGFKGLVQSFGWPVIRNWAVWEKVLADNAKEAKGATREVISIPPFTDIDALRKSEIELLQMAINAGEIIGGAVAFQPNDWTLVRFHIFKEPVGKPTSPEQVTYDVGYMSIS